MFVERLFRRGGDVAYFDFQKKSHREVCDRQSSPRSPSRSSPRARPWRTRFSLQILAQSAAVEDSFLSLQILAQSAAVEDSLKSEKQRLADEKELLQNDLSRARERLAMMSAERLALERQHEQFVTGELGRNQGELCKKRALERLVGTRCLKKESLLDGWSSSCWGVVGKK